jgi:non-reducing end alpha-L-arabinofuranosidase
LKSDRIEKPNNKPKIKLFMKKKSRFLFILTLAFILPVAILLLIVSCEGTQTARSEGPCDIFAEEGTPCVSAHSTTRALYASYNGPLYQVKRQSDGKTLDIGLLQSGYADAAAQDAFCSNTLCWITTIYDQSEKGNHLFQAPPGTFVGPENGGFNTLPIADMAPITISGHKAYGTYIIPGMGLRNNDAAGLGINDEPEGIYMVFDGTHYDSGCCFNYGNTSTNSDAVGRGTMSTVYFGTSTAWGSGAGTGPWIMSDMEAGLFSGYNTKVNEENPTIDSWRFVTGMVNGGGGNIWEIRGGNAQEGDLTTYYKGIRPQSLDNNNYYPMNKKGSIQLGNGGDNGNGSAGTFYEGVMTSGYPTDVAINAVQANIVAAKYDVQRTGLSRVTTFTPGSSQEVDVTFTNTTGKPAKNVKLSVVLPSGWSSVVSDSNDEVKAFSETIAPGETVKATFKITSPTSTGAGYLTGKAEWGNKGGQSDINEQRIRNVVPVKINEFRLSTSLNSTNQFIELYNASDNEVDISNWSLINTRSELAPVKLATIPAGIKLSAKGFYLLGLAGSGLASPASQGENSINVININELKVGQQIDVDGEIRRIQSIGTPAATKTNIFVPVSNIPWLTIPAGSTNIPVRNTNGFVVGQKIGIDKGGNYDEAIVTEVGKAATHTKLAVEAKAGDTIIKINSSINLTVGDILTISTGARKEIVEVKRIINAVAEPPRGGGLELAFSRIPGEVELTAPLKIDHMLAVDVSCPGTGISFSPATRFEHKSGESVQALGSGIKLDRALENNHEMGAPVINSMVKTAGYQGTPAPNQWYGDPLSVSAGSIALMDASGEVVVDAVVYGSLQSNSSANGTVTSPELATLEGVQSQGGCIVVVPGSGRGLPPSNPAMGEVNRSFGLYPDGADNDSNCEDFMIQNFITLLTPTTSGSSNIKIANTTGFSAGQQIIIGSGTKSETATIAEIGTTGGTTVATAVQAGATIIPVVSVEGFSAGQSFSIGNETATVASITAVRRRFGSTNIPVDTIRVTQPVNNSYAVGEKVYGSGITFTTPLTYSYESGTPVKSNLPTPGGPNQYALKP